MRLLIAFVFLFLSSILAAGEVSNPAASTSVVITATSPQFKISLSDLQADPSKKFVYVRIAKVINPDKISLGFAVHYQPNDCKSIYLGNFALFPADNPGEFIVPTQGKVQQTGSISITMEMPESTKPLALVQVEIAEIRFVNALR